jgi:hypothetical protein
LGTIALFIATKDRWNWKKILLWPTLIIILSSATIVTAYFAYDRYKNLPKQITKFWDIPLDSNKSDIKFLKGSPIISSDGTLWEYKIDEDNKYFILFSDEKIKMIGYYGDWLNSPEINGINFHDTPEIIQSKLGIPSYISTSDDEFSKTYSYDKYNTFVSFTQSKIYSFGAYNPSLGHVKYKDEYNGTEPDKLPWERNWSMKELSK